MKKMEKKIEVITVLIRALPPPPATPAGQRSKSQNAALQKGERAKSISSTIGPRTRPTSHRRLCPLPCLLFNAGRRSSYV